MPFDPWPDEPDEPNPERTLPGNLEIPEVSQPEVPEESLSGDVPRVFWASVILVNVALFALSLGPMLIVFRGQWTFGLPLIAVGALALVRTYQLYRKFKAERADESGEEVERESRRSVAVDATDAVDADVDDGDRPADAAERNP